MSFSATDGEFYVLIAKQIDERIDVVAASLANGVAKSHEEYRYYVGQVKALKDMRQWAIDANRASLGLPPLKD
jgi:hypothetical protein